MKTRWVVMVASAAVLAGALVAGCGGGEDGSAEQAAQTEEAAATESSNAGTSAPEEAATTQAEPAGDEFTVGWVPPTVAPFEEAMRAGIQIQAESLGMDVLVAGGQFDPNVQLAAVDTLVQRGVDAITIWPIDQQGIQPAFDRAREANIPIFVIDSPDAKPYAANFQTNDYDTTYALAQYAAEQIGKPCAVAIIQGLPVVPILDARNRGYADGAKAAGCTILDEQVNTNDNVETARAIVSTWKTKYGSELNGILAVNDPSALAALSAVGGDFDPVITGLNGDAENIEKIADGQIAATAALLSPEIGNALAYAAYEELTGNPVPEEIAVEYFIVTKDNVAEYKSYEERLASPMKVEFVDQGGMAVLQATAE